MEGKWNARPKWKVKKKSRRIACPRCGGHSCSTAVARPPPERSFYEHLAEVLIGAAAWRQSPPRVERAGAMSKPRAPRLGAGSRWSVVEDENGTALCTDPKTRNSNVIT